MEKTYTLDEPSKEFKNYKTKHKEKVEKYIEDLVNVSKIDVEANKRLNKKLDELNAGRKNNAKKRTAAVVWRILLIIIFAAGITAGVIIGLKMNNLLITILPAVGCALFLIFFTIFLSKIIKKLNALIADLDKKILEQENLCWQNIAPFLQLLKQDTAQVLMEDVAPIFNFDDYFDASKFVYLRDKFGFKDIDDDDVSIVGVKSGFINGSPFVIEKMKVHSTVQKMYTGSVSYTYTTHDKNGTHVHTAVLTASIYKPYPNYSDVTCLVFGNDAGEKLTFSRQATKGFSEMSEKALQKKVDANKKKLDKREHKDLVDKDEKTNFTQLANTEFETLFNCTDRDNEVQFRVLFTPLAQANIVHLIKNHPYDDDFAFYKNLKINRIISAHSQKFDYNLPVTELFDTSIVRCCEKLRNYYGNFFDYVYYDFAPILSIPIYQSTKPFEFIYDKKIDYNYSPYEAEVIANKYPINKLVNPTTNFNDCILKCRTSKKSGEYDNTKIEALSYHGTQKTEIVSKMGKDGRMHAIPIQWVDYSLVKQTNSMAFKNVNFKGEVNKGGSQINYADLFLKSINKKMEGNQNNEDVAETLNFVSYLNKVM